MSNATLKVWSRLDEEAREAVVDLARRWACEPAAVLAVIEVESAGRIFATVRGRSEPLIRWEGHWFHRLLAEPRRTAARRAGLAHPKAGRVRNPASQRGRWALLDRAVAIDRRAALSSCSWGLGQVMGFHWRRLGFASADALVAEARRGAAGQIALMARFVDAEDLAPLLGKRDWHGFARRYNGPAYKRHGYHTRLARAFARAQALDLAAGPALPKPAAQGEGALEGGTPMFGALMFGARGPAVRRLQRALSRAGHPLRADGLFGIRTDRALRRWQESRGAEPTGTLRLGDVWHLFGAFAAVRLLWRIVIERCRVALSAAAPGT